MFSEAPTINVVDDDASVLKSLARLLQSARYRVRTYDSALDFLAEYHDGTAGCLILDVRMPELSGLDLQDRLQDGDIRIPIIFITGHGDIPMTVRAMKGGAHDFLTKPYEARHLLEVVAEAVKRDRLARRERDELAFLRRHLDSLTPREGEVFGLVVTGLLNKQIAAELGVSEKTVKVHRARVMTKMQAESLAELVHMAERLGMGLAEQ